MYPKASRNRARATKHHLAPVAQLDRVLGFEPRGRGVRIAPGAPYKLGVSLMANSFFFCGDPLRTQIERMELVIRYLNK